jgi:hypothetical protein
MQEKLVTKEDVIEASSKQAEAVVKSENPIDLMEFIEKKKFMTYKLKGDYGDALTSLRFKRWPVGVAMELYPLAADIIAAVVSRLVRANASGEQFNLFKFLEEDGLHKMIRSNLEHILRIIARSLTLCKDNRFSNLEEANRFVSELELFDVVDICKLLYRQNMEDLVKNFQGPSPSP